jgi:hypothetical protein
LYEYIITKFRCPTHLVSEQGSHFNNETIKILIVEFMITHQYESTIYYPQGNGQMEFTNKTLKWIIIKLVNINLMDWDVILLTALWACRMTYKLTTRHTPYELVYDSTTPKCILVLLGFNRYWMNLNIFTMVKLNQPSNEWGPIAIDIELVHSYLLKYKFYQAISIAN